MKMVDRMRIIQNQEISFRTRQGIKSLRSVTNLSMQVKHRVRLCQTLQIREPTSLLNQLSIVFCGKKKCRIIVDEATKSKKPTTYRATAPNQVYMWDITYLNGPHKGMFYYLYLFSDLYDRSIVGWEVYEEESAEHASELIQQIGLKQGRLTTQPLVLHSDNGSPMKGATMLSTLYQLGITPSNSRPRVSNDNPYAESLFKTLKYRPDYQPKGFATLQEAREWVSLFVQWYNYEHHHSGLKFLTPDQRRSGKSQEILEKRHQVYEAAKEKYPERWNGRATRDWSLPDIVYLNPETEADRLSSVGF